MIIKNIMREGRIITKVMMEGGSDDYKGYDGECDGKIGLDGGRVG